MTQHGYSCFPKKYDPYPKINQCPSSLPLIASCDDCAQSYMLFDNYLYAENVSSFLTSKGKLSVVSTHLSLLICPLQPRPMSGLRPFSAWS